MALPNNIRDRLVLEGLVNFDNFNDFKEDQLNQAFKNMRTATPVIPAVDAAGGAVAVPYVAPVPLVIFLQRVTFVSMLHRLRITTTFQLAGLLPQPI